MNDTDQTPGVDRDTLARVIPDPLRARIEALCADADRDPDYRGHVRSGALRAALAAPDPRPDQDYTVEHDFPGWADLTPEQKGHVADIEAAAFWRGYNYLAPARDAAEDQR